MNTVLYEDVHDARQNITIHMMNNTNLFDKINNDKKKQQELFQFLIVNQIY